MGVAEHSLMRTRQTQTPPLSVAEHVLEVSFTVLADLA